MNYFDSHCHLQLPEFDADREAVLARMREHDVGGVVVGVDLPTSRAAIALAHQHDLLWAAIGLHPNDNPDEHFDETAFAELAHDPKVVAIGECGLDYFRGADDETRREQRERFEKQIALALAAGKPLVIHCRAKAGTQDAHEDMIATLKEAKSRAPEGARLSVVMHFFTSTREIAERYLALGCFLSFPGVITFTNMYDDAVRATPLGRLLSETDSPFAAPVPHRGACNEPVYVIETIRRLAELKQLPLEAMAAQIAQNSRVVFSLRS